MLAQPFCVWIGKRSYSLYLWHWPVFVVLRWTVGVDDATTRSIGIALAFAMAALSYHWVELPIRHHSGLLRRSPVVRIAVLLLATVAGWGVTRGIFSQQKVLSLSAPSRNADEWHVSSRMPGSLLPAT